MEEPPHFDGRLWLCAWHQSILTYACGLYKQTADFRKCKQTADYRKCKQTADFEKLKEIVDLLKYKQIVDF